MKEMREQSPGGVVGSRRGEPPYLAHDYVATRLRAPKEPLIILPSKEGPSRRALKTVADRMQAEGHKVSTHAGAGRQREDQPAGSPTIYDRA